MRAALIRDGIRIENRRPLPRVPPGWALIRVHLSGICGTDLELIKGYRAFRGIPGHEFVGTVTDCDPPGWVGKRVVGEINVGCGVCTFCREGQKNHCAKRRVLGISDLDGCMADYCMLPAENLIEVPDDMPNQKAVFMEPLAAALEIVEQVKPCGSEEAVILGDGPLGILCAWVLSTVLRRVTLAGRYNDKLELAGWRQIRTIKADRIGDIRADLVVEATGSAAGMQQAMAICRPRGSIVLKSTVVAGAHLNLTPLVINEINVVGSRCGPLQKAVEMVSEYPAMPLESLISSKYPISEAPAAFLAAGKGSSLKIIVSMI